LIGLIYKITNDNENFNKDYALRDQMRRSCISISSNIAEGFDRETTKEFIRFLTISKALASEFKSQLYLALDLKYINNEEFEDLIEKTTEISKLIFGLIKYLKTKI
jgi:four helix bundle protein